MRIEAKGMTAAWARLAVFLGAALLAAGCVYDAPLTAAGTRAVDARLVGTWTTADGSDTVEITPLGPKEYRVYYNGDPFRVWHSDVEGIPLVTAQQESGTEHKYSYVAWALSADGHRLRALAVSSQAVPAAAAGTTAAARTALVRHRDDPALFGDEPLDLVRAR